MRAMQLKSPGLFERKIFKAWNGWIRVPQHTQLGPSDVFCGRRQ